MSETGDDARDRDWVKDLPPLPEDAILVHIGVHKTGTTALQGDLRRCRQKLALHGVTLPMTTLSQHRAGRALVGCELGWETTRTPRERLSAWNQFADEVRGHPGRVLLSSEALCQADDKQAKHLVDSLGRDRVYILVAFRQLMTLLPSSWQQYLKSGKDLTYEEWLTSVLADHADESVTPTFWRRNDVPDQLRRWSSFGGADRVTAVVIEGREDQKVRRAMEVLQCLPSGVLSPPRAAVRSNRSLTVAEAEFVRQVNVASKALLSSPDYLSMVRAGAIRLMVEGRTPGPLEGRVGLPESAVPRVRDIGRGQAHALRASGVHLVGPAEILAKCSSSVTPDERDQLPTAAAALALIGALTQAATRQPARTAKERVRTPSVRAKCRNRLRAPTKWVARQTNKVSQFIGR